MTIQATIGSNNYTLLKFQIHNQQALIIKCQAKGKKKSIKLNDKDKNKINGLLAHENQGFFFSLLCN